MGRRRRTGAIYKDAMDAAKPSGHLKEMRNELPRGKLRGIKPAEIKDDQKLYNRNAPFKARQGERHLRFR